jgi:hypothetical protein
MKWNIFVDGDNVPMQRYIDRIHDDLKLFIGNVEVQPIVYCQSNLVFKYRPDVDFKVTLRCCKTRNKNATDARILMDAGCAIQRGERVVIVSNDNIFKEIESEDVIIVQFSFPKQSKLQKKAILRIIKEFKESREPHEDIYISDLLEYFPVYKMERIRKYIENTPELGINQNDGIYLV